MSNKTYDLLKALAQTILPALGTLYYAVAEIWGFSFGEEVVATIIAIDTFLGVLLDISSTRYYKKIQEEVPKEFNNAEGGTENINGGEN